MAKSEENSKTEDELLEEMIAAEEKNDPDADILGDPGAPMYGSGPGEDPDDEPLAPPVAPAAVDPSVVETTASGKKFGWQQAPTRNVAPVEACFHMGLVQARKQIANQEIGHEWVCTCGTEFKVSLNTSGKKILRESGL